MEINYIQYVQNNGYATKFLVFYHVPDCLSRPESP